LGFQSPDKFATTQTELGLISAPATPALRSIPT
jgi:hypothetical protein